MAEKLAAAELARELAGLPGWRHDAAAGRLTRELAFADFAEAFGFMTHVALLAQAADHHPDWSNSYDKVSICLSTHSAGGVTTKDIALARRIDEIRPAEI